jgi:ABC-type transport system substrate-binding protein
MRLSSWLPLAVLSASAVCGAATRPRYGGTLRVEMLAAPAALDPTAANAAPLRSLAFETLVRLDEAGAPQPCLALSWQHDAAARRWQFNLRPAVKFHDGSPLTAAVAAPLLQAALPAMTIAATPICCSIWRTTVGWTPARSARLRSSRAAAPRSPPTKTTGAAVPSSMLSTSNSAARCAISSPTSNSARPTSWR